MKNFDLKNICYVLSIVLIMFTLNADSDDSPKDYSRDAVSPLSNSLSRIESSSPILGTKLVETIKSDSDHPNLIFEKILESYPELNRDLNLSSIVYFSTLIEPLLEFCNGTALPQTNQKWTTKVTAAIPDQVIDRFNPRYQKIRPRMVDVMSDFDDVGVQKLSQEFAVSFQGVRENCRLIQKLHRLKHNAKFFFNLLPPVFFDPFGTLHNKMELLVETNVKIFSPEASFPRLQFSINGFTKYVYQELLKLPNLQTLLTVIYDAEIQWLKATEELQQMDSSLFLEENMISYVERKALSAGFQPRNILLALAYSKRNLPSLDHQYATNTEKALLLEIFFWKFNHIRNTVKEKYLAHLFPYGEFDRDPGVYHYLTAAFQACELRQAGFSKLTGQVSAIGGKSGYKFHKLLAAFKIKDVLKGGLDGVKKVIQLAQHQGFATGLQAGIYGGSHGADFCD